MPTKPILTPQLRELLVIARERVDTLDELGYRPLAKANSALRFQLQIDEAPKEKYFKACLIVEMSAGTNKEPANLYDLSKKELLEAIDKALNKGRKSNGKPGV